MPGSELEADAHINDRKHFSETANNIFCIYLSIYLEKERTGKNITGVFTMIIFASDIRCLILSLLSKFLKYRSVVSVSNIHTDTYTKCF